MEPTEHLSLELSLEPESAARARAAISPLRPYADTSSFDDVRLMVSELVSDALAVEPRPVEALITLEAHVLDGNIWIMVTFNGVALPVPAGKPEPAEPGWGIYLVRTLASRWSAGRSPESTYVWFAT